ncbi:MAG: hypothetical protein ABI898_01085 [Sphingomonadales bacterium]
MRVLAFFLLLVVGQPGIAQNVRNVEPQPKSLVKVLVVWVLGYEDAPSSTRIIADKPIMNLGKGVEVAANNPAGSAKKRVELRP